MFWPLAWASTVRDYERALDVVTAENRELRGALHLAHIDLRQYKTLFADLRTEPEKTLARIHAAHHGAKP